MIGMTALLAGEQSLDVVPCQLLRQERCEVTFPASEQSTLGLGTAEQDATLQMNQIEIDGIEVFVV